MTDTPKTDAPRPIIARAGENGLYISGMMCLLLLLLGAGTAVPLLANLFALGALAFPFVVLVFISNRCMRAGRPMSFAEIWAEGIASFFLGSLLPAVMAYALLRFAFPTFIYEQVQGTIAMLGAIPGAEAETLADTITRLRDSGNLPTPADIAANIISFNIVAGTALSLFMAIVVSARMRMGRFRNNNCNS